MIPLPIDAIRSQLDHALESERPIIVAAPTGSGKSTRLPQMLVDAIGAPILVVEPRRVACRALAERVAHETKSRLGEEIGYAVRFEERASPNTRILFVTPGIALRRLAADQLRGFRALLIDEFHERGWQTDLVAALARAQGSPRLVLTSATLDTAPLVEALDALLIEASGRTFPVDVSWTDEPAEPSHRELAARAATVVHQELRDTQEGDILVFLPGRGEIADTESSLGRLPPRVEVHSIHGSIPLDRLQKAFQPDPDRRRVYLSTNIAETSLTIPGVTCVIDSGLERAILHRAGRNVLALQPISLSSMDQRAGRAGRVAPGRCIRLFARRFRPRPDTAPELERIALDEVVVRAAAAGLEGEAFTRAPWITPPPEFAVKSARERLRSAGLLDDDSCLTNAGRALLPLPLDATDALLLQHPDPHIRGHLADLLALRTMRRSPLLPLDSLPRHAREHATTARSTLFEGVTHEPAMLLRVLRRGDPRTHHLDAHTLREARASAKQLKDAVQASSDTADPDWRKVGIAIARAWPESPFVLRARATKQRRKRAYTQPWTNGEVEVELAPFSPTGSETEPAHASCGVLLETAWIGDGATGFRGRGRLLIPLRPTDLVEAGAGTLQAGDLRIDRSRGTLRILREEERRIAEIVLSTGEVPLQGPALLDAAASLLLDGRIIRGVSDALLDRLHWGAIALGLPEPLQPAHRFPPTSPLPEDAHSWLRDTLAELGVQQAADLQLLEVGDLLPDLSAITGWPDFELDRLSADFPRIWEHQGASWRCDIRPAAGRVTLIPLNRDAKSMGPPDPLVVPRFRNFRVRWKKAEREVSIR